jgi:heme exporter protein A
MEHECFAHCCSRLVQFGRFSDGIMPMRVTGTQLACVRGGRQVFSGLDFAVQSGEALVLTGRNGAGKTTLLRLIAGLLLPAAGTLVVEGGDGELTLAEQAHYLGHRDALKPSLTVAENLDFWAAYLGGGSGAGARSDALAAAGLADLVRLPAGYLSAGQRRRLSIARLLAAPRPIWLLDEPTAALDVAAQARLADLMRGHLGAGGLIIAATHGPLGLEGTKELKMGGNA